MVAETTMAEALHIPHGEAAFAWHLASPRKGLFRAETGDGAAIALRAGQGEVVIMGSPVRVRSQIAAHFPNATEIKAKGRMAAKPRGIAAALPQAPKPAVHRPPIVAPYPERRDPMDDIPAQIKARPHFGTFRVTSRGMVDTEKGAALRRAREGRR